MHPMMPAAPQSALPPSLGFVAILLGACVTIFWMVCAWRAMRAHERLADAVETMAGRGMEKDL